MNIRDQLVEMDLWEWDQISRRLWKMYFCYHPEQRVSPSKCQTYVDVRIEATRRALAGLCGCPYDT